MTKFVTNENLKQVLQKLKAEINRQASSKSSLIEGYFRILMNSRYLGLKCKVYEFSDRYEVYSNLEVNTSYDKSLSDLKTDRLITLTIQVGINYSSWKSLFPTYASYARLCFKLGNDYFVCDDNTSKDLVNIYFTDNTTHYVYLGTVYKA